MPSRHSNSIKQENLAMNYDDINKSFRPLNKALDDLDKGIRLQKRQGAIKLLNTVSADMRRNNANDHSIRIALRGTWEYLRIVTGVTLAKSDLSQLNNPEQTAHQDVEIAGTFLSEIAAQQGESLDMKDLKKVNIYDRPFSLSHDLRELEKAIKQTKAILVVLDPLTAVLGHNIDSSRDQATREILTPLSHLAECTNCAILIIRHLKKSTSDNLLYRGAGPISIIAAARCGLIVAYDPTDEQKRVLATTKNNLSERAVNLSYKVVQNECGVPYIQWLGENNHDVSTLVGPGINLSFARQDIIKVLQEASSPLEAKEIAEQTGQNYKSIRMTLIRMHEAGLIARPYRGKYITLNHPFMAKRASFWRHL
jgi:AAA domain